MKLLQRPIVGMGSRFIEDGEEYILAHVDGSRMCLINLKTGNRWKDPIKVESITDVSEGELKLLTEV